MSRPRVSNPVAVALFANAAALGLVAMALFGRGSTPDFASIARAQQMPIAGGAGFFVMPAQFSSNAWGCYLMDVDAQTLLAYQWDTGRKMLNLVAARSFDNDKRLRNFNTNPAPDEVRSLVDLEAAPARTTEDRGTSNPEELPTDSE